MWSNSLKQFGKTLGDPVQDAFIEECELIRADLLQSDLDVQGEFVSEETMRDEWNWSEPTSVNFDKCTVFDFWFPPTSNQNPIA